MSFSIARAGEGPGEYVLGANILWPYDVFSTDGDDHATSQSVLQVPSGHPQASARGPWDPARPVAAGGSYGNCIELLPVRGIAEMREFVAGMDPRFEREPDREP